MGKKIRRVKRKEARKMTLTVLDTSCNSSSTVEKLYVPVVIKQPKSLKGKMNALKIRAKKRQNHSKPNDLAVKTINQNFNDLEKEIYRTIK